MSLFYRSQNSKEELSDGWLGLVFSTSKLELPTLRKNAVSNFLRSDWKLSSFCLQLELHQNDKISTVKHTKQFGAGKRTPLRGSEATRCVVCMNESNKIDVTI